jgi:hypothetical protein
MNFFFLKSPAVFLQKLAPMSPLECKPLNDSLNFASSVAMLGIS